MQTTNSKRTEPLYQLLFNHLAGIHNKFYRKITVIGKENIPQGEAFFVTPNHQNTMMDAMSILFTIGRPYPVFMARADLFKNKTVGKFMTFIKILPVFRIRDGKDSLKNNNAVFNRTIDIVRRGMPLIIYPEGNHDGHRCFRGAKKGVIRVSFSALEQFEEGKNLYIIPTGLEYNTSYEKANQSLVVFYGKPILVNDFMDIYREDKARGERQLQLAINARMTDQMIDIKSKEYYDLFDIIRETAYVPLLKKRQIEDNPEQKLYAQQEMVKVLSAELERDDSKFAELQEKARGCRDITKRLKLRDWLFNEEKHAVGSIFTKALLGLLCLPLAIYGWVFNGLQIIFTNHKANKMKDPQWRSTMRFVMGFTLFPISHLILTLISLSFFENNWWSLVFLASLVFSYVFVSRYQIWMKKLFGQIRYNKLSKNGDADFLKAKQCREDINKFVLALVK